MSLGTSNRDGGKTSESGHLRPLSKMFGGNILGDVKTSLKVVQRAAGANMSVDVGIGDAMLYRSDGTYGHPVFNDAVYNQVIAAADGSNPRRDIIVIYVDYGQTPSTAVSNNTNGVVKIKSVAGTPAGSPADPSAAAIQSSVGSGNPWAYLARVRVGAGVTTISDSVIDDLRIGALSNMFAPPAYGDIINASCRVAQLPAAPSLTTSYVYGKVDRFACKGAGTAVNAGTIDQTTSANVGGSGYALKIAGATITGTGKVYCRYRMESKDAIRYKNRRASFQVKVYHDVGSAVNYVIYIRKANSADNFGAVTAIVDSGNISVPSGVPTTISLENINNGDLGDVSNGLEIEIEASCGAITIKNFEFAEFMLNRGVIAQQYVARNFNEEYLDCARYRWVRTTIGTNQTQVSGMGYAASTTRCVFDMRVPVPMRINPSIVGTATDWQAADGVAAGLDATAWAISTDPISTAEVPVLQITVSGANSKQPYIMRGDAGNNRTLTLDAEL